MHDSLTIALLQAREAAMAYFRPIVKRHNLTEQQWRIVRVLAESPSMDFHDLAFRTCILRPSLTGILTRMERDGLVVEKPSPDDARAKRICLTQDGRDFMNEILPPHYLRVTKLMEKLSEEEQHELIRLLKKLSG